MRITEIGDFWGINDEAPSIDFFSNSYFIDSEVIFIRLTSIQKELNSLVNNPRRITYDEVELLDYWIERKRNEINEFYQLGGTAVLVGDARPTLFFLKEGYTENHHKIDIISLFSNGYFLSYKPNEGSNFINNPLVKPLTQIFDITFHFVLETFGKSFKTLFTTIKSKQPISISLKRQEGLLLILPDISPKNQNMSWNEIQNEFLEQIVELIKDQKDNWLDIISNAPAWIDQIILNKVVGDNLMLDKLNDEKAVLDKKISKIEETLLEYSFLKSIIYTKGKYLEWGVKKFFNYLNIDVILPEGSNTDMVIDDNQSYFAIEIKGGVGSATKQHVRQLEEWVNSCALKYHVDDAKGILIINTYHNIPIDKRIDIDFPPNVIEFSKPRKHCLVTTITLLKLINAFDTGKIDKKGILKMFKDTSGELNYK